MALVRIIGLATSNDHKLHECQRVFEPYGIFVLKIDPKAPPSAFFNTKAAVLAEQCGKPVNSKIRPLFVAKEQTTLYSTRHCEVSPSLLPMLAPCVHVSDLCVTDQSGLQVMYQARVEGYIDHSRRDIEGNHYDWDDIFVVSRLGKTYLELHHFDHKISARDQVLSQFLKDKFYYKTPRSLYHNDLCLTGGIDHRVDPYTFLSTVPEYNLASPMLVRNIPKAAVNIGFFFRSAENRRQALYWSPGSNAGLPLVAKPKDPMHEKVFMFHDMSHFCIPDLIFAPSRDISTNEQDLERRVYVMYRLLSEAITLVLADMIMVDACEQAGYRYDTKLKRKIFPVFEHLKRAVPNYLDPDMLYQILYGSAEYCFWNDTSVWKALMNATEHDAQKELDEFTGKYDAYFREDLKWTVANYKDMCLDADHRHVWWQEVHAFVPELFSVKEWIKNFHSQSKDLSNSRVLLKHVFDSIYQTYIAPLLKQEVVVADPITRFVRTFSSYMAFQMRLFYKVEAVDPSVRSMYIEPLQRGLHRFRMSHWDDISEGHEAATCLRDFYDKALMDLAGKLLISNDDVAVYREVYPLFRAKLVDYDHEQSKDTVLVASSYFAVNK